MELVGHWWNRSWGAITRKDIRVYALEAGFLVAWVGDNNRTGGELRCADQAEVERVVESLVRKAGGNWRDISSTHAPRSQQAHAQDADDVSR